MQSQNVHSWLIMCAMPAADGGDVLSPATGVQGRQPSQVGRVSAQTRLPAPSCTSLSRGFLTSCVSVHLGISQSAGVGGRQAGDKAPADGGGQALAVGDGAQGFEGLGRGAGAGDAQDQSSSLSQSPGNVMRKAVMNCMLSVGALCHRW